ncbi:unnamed protein product [Mytilus coruscus]|uniref:Uncharacterized protein n=1 Tax=Mytilus coruscus TaxID=42192 RepID=A0A6J8DPV5_MYTCO|nr:unnamed protein product [Mytilus coruscus]
MENLETLKKTKDQKFEIANKEWKKGVAEIAKSASRHFLQSKSNSGLKYAYIKTISKTVGIVDVGDNIPRDMDSELAEQDEKLVLIVKKNHNFNVDNKRLSILLSADIVHIDGEFALVLVLRSILLEELRRGVATYNGIVSSSSLLHECKQRLTYEGANIAEPISQSEEDQLAFVDSHFHLDQILRRMRLRNFQHLQSVVALAALNIFYGVANYVFPSRWNNWASDVGFATWYIESDMEVDDPPAEGSIKRTKVSNETCELVCDIDNNSDNNSETSEQYPELTKLLSWQN